MRGGVACLIMATLTACGARELSDADVLEYASSTYDKRAMQGRTLVLGRHRGVEVLVEFPCADLCPAYTTRVVRYALPAGTECAAQGGVEKLISVPEGIGRKERSYCVPAVLAANWERYRRW